MAKKHFDDYYNTICKQFFSLQEVFDEMGKSVSEGMVEPERLEQLKLTIEPVKASYQTLSYVKYLLDMPNRNNKVKKYTRRNHKMLTNSNNRQGPDIINNNDKAIQQAKNQIHIK